MLRHIRLVALLAILGAVPSWASAEQVRYRFVPVDACGKTAQVPVGPDGTIGELKRVYGARALPYPYAVRPNQMVTFRHPGNGRLVTVPLRLPAGTPRLEHRPDRIVYLYGDYTVEAHFQPNGAVDVIYNSGFMRPLQFD